MDGTMIPIVAIIAVFSFLTVGAVVDAWKKRGIRAQLEESRREIAAYVAEGSISPDDAERLLHTDPDGVGDRD